MFGGSPPHPPLQLEDPSLNPKPFPPRPLPPSSPHPPWFFLQCSGSPGRGGPVWCGGRGPRGGWGGRALQRYLGPDPHLGVLDLTACLDAQVSDLVAQRLRGGQNVSSECSLLFFSLFFLRPSRNSLLFWSVFCQGVMHTPLEQLSSACG